MMIHRQWFHARQYLVFAIVGGVGTGLALILTAIFTEVFHLWYLFSYVIATLIAWTFNFCLNSLVTFRGQSESDHGRKYIQFISLYVVAFTVNATLVYILTSILGLHYLISIIFVTVIISVFTFWWSRYKIFKHEKAN